jgi:hypothetical protein
MLKVITKKGWSEVSCFGNCICGCVAFDMLVNHQEMLKIGCFILTCLNIISLLGKSRQQLSFTVYRRCSQPKIYVNH